MLSTRSGFKTSYHKLTLLVVREFDQWKTLVYGDGVTIHGLPMFAEDKAKAHALSLAQSFEQEHQPSPEGDGAQELAWTPTSREDWLVWKG